MEEPEKYLETLYLETDEREEMKDEGRALSSLWVVAGAEQGARDRAEAAELEHNTMGII